MAVLAVAGLPTAGLAATTVVHPGALAGWSVETTGGIGTAGQFVSGPGTPPAGAGSYRQTVGNGNDSQSIQTAAYNGTALTSLAELAYATYVTDNNGAQASYMQLVVDLNGDAAYTSGTDDILFFEPAYQTGSYGGSAVPNQCPGVTSCVAVGSWQAWDADAGGWWSLNAGAFGPPLTTLAAYATAHPGAALVTDRPSLRLTAGGGFSSWLGFDGNVDAVTVNGTTYDFETLYTLVDCDTAVDDIASVQGAVNAAPSSGWTISLKGTCDFSAAEAHGGDIASIAAAAVVVRPGSPVGGLTIQSHGAPQSASVVGSGDEAAFYVAPGNGNVTIRGLRFVNLGRAVVAHNTANTTVGALGAMPEPSANRIVGDAGMSSAILAIANDRGFSSPAGTAVVRYGAAGASVATFTIPAGQKLTGFRAHGNYISYNPPGAPDGQTRDVVAIDVRQRNGGFGDGIDVRGNAVGMFTSEFPSFNMNGVRVHAHSGGDSRIHNVTVSGNNLGRLEEVMPVADIHAAGRAAIVLSRVTTFQVTGNGLRSRLSPTGVPMPGGGIVAGDSSNGTIGGNGIIVLADPSTMNSDLGAVGVIEDMQVLFGSPAAPPSAERVLVTGNIVGPVTSDTPGLGAQRAFVLNGAKHSTVTGNTVKFSSGPAVSIGVRAEGPGNLGAPGINALHGAVLESVVCGNVLDGVADNQNEMSVDQGIGNANNAFPAGEAYTGNLPCRPTINLSATALTPTDALTVSGSSWAARSARVTLTGPGGAPITKTVTTSATGAYSATFTTTEIGTFSDGVLTVAVTPLDDLSTTAGQPSSANVTKGAVSTMTYNSASSNAVPLPDITGQGIATASASADRFSGRLTVETSASDTLPAGVNVFGIGVGSSSAYAEGKVRHELPAGSGGTWVVTTTLADTSATSSATGTYLSFLSGAYGQAYTAATAVYQCVTGCPSGGTIKTASAYRYLACTPGTCSTTPTVQLSVVIDVPAGQTGRIIVDAGLFAGSVVNGAGTASARASAVMRSITATRV